MRSTTSTDHRIAAMLVGSVYPLYLQKIEKKGRTEDELLVVMSWLTGYSQKELQRLVKSKITFADFFASATLHPNAKLIKGVICGYRVEEITNVLTQQVRYLDKLVDELAKGRSLDKIMRV